MCVQPDAIYRKVILNGPATHYRVREQVLGTYTARLRAPNLGHRLPSHTARSTGAEQLYMLATLCACGPQGGLTWCSNRVWPRWPAPGTVGKQEPTAYTNHAHAGMYAVLRMLPRPRGRPRGPYGPSRAATAPLRDFPPLLLPALDACWPRARSQPSCGSELPRRAAFRRPRCASSLPRRTRRARAIPPAQFGAQACSASASEVASTQAWARTIRRLLP